ncbi:hypothetical protein Srubr_77950 [Streptomyces rubradiris]|uniref:Uncharacterized protein n=1 Tax=Streptomyces rubradiris TaxID=285531 RepID=A0ABQ3RQ24_STRRR|nr:hypothetical protein Srubr_77950 [Streptomyces rubradiris]
MPGVDPGPGVPAAIALTGAPYVRHHGPHGSPAVRTGPRAAPVRGTVRRPAGGAFRFLARPPGEGPPGRPAAPSRPPTPVRASAARPRPPPAGPPVTAPRRRGLPSG